MSDRFNNRHRCSPKNPCRVCGGTKFPCVNLPNGKVWCEIQFRDDGGEGRWLEGKGVYLHTTDQDFSPRDSHEGRPELNPSSEEVPRTWDEAVLARGARALMEVCAPLPADHPFALELATEKRGQMGPKAYNARGYAIYNPADFRPPSGRNARLSWTTYAGEKIREAFDSGRQGQDKACSLPWYRCETDGNGRPRSSTPRPRSSSDEDPLERLLLPVRNPEGKPIIFQVMDPEGRPRYKTLSNARGSFAANAEHGGFHTAVPTGHKEPLKGWSTLITGVDGVLKADIIADLTGFPVLAALGITMFPSPPLPGQPESPPFQMFKRHLEAIRDKAVREGTPVRKVILPMDMDKGKNARQAARDARRRLQACLLTVFPAVEIVHRTWNADKAKGYDDALIADLTTSDRLLPPPHSESAEAKLTAIPRPEEKKRAEQRISDLHRIAKTFAYSAMAGDMDEWGRQGYINTSGSGAGKSTSVKLAAEEIVQEDLDIVILRLVPSYKAAREIDPLTGIDAWEKWEIIPGMDGEDESGNAVCHMPKSIRDAHHTRNAPKSICERCTLRAACKVGDAGGPSYRRRQRPAGRLLQAVGDKLSKNTLEEIQRAHKGSRVFVIFDDVDADPKLLRSIRIGRDDLNHKHGLASTERAAGLAPARELLRMVHDYLNERTADPKADPHSRRWQRPGRELVPELAAWAHLKGLDPMEIVLRSEQADETYEEDEKDIIETKGGGERHWVRAMIDTLSREFLEHDKAIKEGRQYNSRCLTYWDAKNNELRLEIKVPTPFGDALRYIQKERIGVMVSNQDADPVHQVTKWFPWLTFESEHLDARAHLPAGVTVNQWVTRRWTMTALLGQTHEDEATPSRRAANLAAFLNKLEELAGDTPREKLGIITFGGVLESEEFKARFPVLGFKGKFWGTRSDNGAKGVWKMIVAGNPSPAEDSFTSSMEALYGYAEEALDRQWLRESYRLRDKNGKPEGVDRTRRRPRDSRLYHRWEAMTIGEMLQCVMRPRPYNVGTDGRESLIIHVVSDLPLGPNIPVTLYGAKLEPEPREQVNAASVRRAAQEINRNTGTSRRISIRKLSEATSLTLHQVRASLTWLDRNSSDWWNPEDTFENTSATAQGWITGVIITTSILPVFETVPNLGSSGALPPPPGPPSSD